MRSGAEEVTQAIREQITANHADHLIHTTRTRCNGRCDDACVVIVYPQGVWYKDVKPEDAPTLVVQHLLNGQILENRSLYTYESTFKATGVGERGERKKQS
jgi:(2Fe-2S) ferredoxin